VKDSQDWLDEILEEFGLDDRYNFEDRLHDRITDDEMCEQYEAFYNKAKSAIRKHILQEALEMIGEDESDDNVVINDLYMATRNGLRQELRNKFNDKYKED
jgi:hypothetical protein